MISAIHEELGVTPLDDEVLAAKRTSKLVGVARNDGVPCWND